MHKWAHKWSQFPAKPLIAFDAIAPRRTRNLRALSHDGWLARASTSDCLGSRTHHADPENDTSVGAQTQTVELHDMQICHGNGAEYNGVGPQGHTHKSSAQDMC